MKKTTKPIRIPPQCGGYALLRLTIRKSYGFKDDSKEESQRMESELIVPVNTLITGEHPTASVTSSVSTKVSDAVYYPPGGTWDKIPYSVEVFSSVTLHCDQTDETIREGQGMANQLAWEASHKHIFNAVVGHVVDIKQRLCAECFSEEEE